MLTAQGMLRVGMTTNSVMDDLGKSHGVSRRGLTTFRIHKEIGMRREKSDESIVGLFARPLEMVH